MGPITLTAAQKLSLLLTDNNAYNAALQISATAANTVVPLVTSGQIALSSAAPDMGDKDLELTYPRICLYSTGLRATHQEMFQSFSGSVNLVADIWTSANLLTQSELWAHVYTDALSAVLRQNVGDWADGFFFNGAYEVQVQAPKAGGLGYVHLVRVTIPLTVNLS